MVISINEKVRRSRTFWVERKSGTEASVFARQEDDTLDTLAEHSIGAAIKLHLRQGKIRVVKLLPVRLLTVAVITDNRALLIAMDLDGPDLECLRFDVPVLLLPDAHD